MLGYIYLYFILSESDRIPKIILQAIAPPKSHYLNKTVF